MSRQNREKRSDLMRKGQPFFGRWVDSFKEAYPTIENLQVEVTQTDASRGSSFTQKLSEKNFRDVIDCSNPLCYGGGVVLGSLLHSMVWKGETSREEHSGCGGYEGSPKGRRKYRSCSRGFRVKIKVDYLDGGEAAGPDA